MATQAQIQANRRNAQKSTGPRTPAGKKIVSQNASTHGFFSKNALVRRDDAVEFENYRAAMLADLAPVGHLETTLADRVIVLTWQLARTVRIESERLGVQLDNNFSGISVRDFSTYRLLDRLSIYEQRIQKLFLIALHQFEILRQKRTQLAEQTPAQYVIDKLRENS